MHLIIISISANDVVIAGSVAFVTFEVVWTHDILKHLMELSMAEPC